MESVRFVLRDGDINFTPKDIAKALRYVALGALGIAELLDPVNKKGK